MKDILLQQILFFKKFPLLGSGIKGFRNQCYGLNKNNYKNKTIWCTTHPHNIFFSNNFRNWIIWVNYIFNTVLLCS